MNITDKEREIIEHIKPGMTNREIARKMYISKKTLENAISRLLEKTGCPNKIALVSYAYENGILKYADNTTPEENKRG